MRNNFNFLPNIYDQKKGSRFSIAAFLLLITAFLSSACESPGSIGNDIISEDETVESMTVYIDDYSVLEENSFSGRLENTSVGYYEDPVYGTVQSIALLKPSISTTDIDTIRTNDTIYLRLIFNEPVYGDSATVSNFSIYEAGEIWRGAELRYNNEVPVDMSSKVGDFQVTADEDTVMVELANTWTEKYATFFNSDTTLSVSQRDSIYIRNFPGLAIVPSENNRNIRFLKTRTSAEDSDTDQEITSFMFESILDDEEDELTPLAVRDWGASFTRQNGAEEEGSFVLHNSERVLKLPLNLPVDELSEENIVNAQLIFSKNVTAVENIPGVSRPTNDLVRIHVFDNEPSDVMAEIFVREPPFSTSLDDAANVFKVNISQHIVNEVYGGQSDRILYLTIQSVNGVIYSSHFFDQTAADIRKPRLVITYAK